MEQIKRKFQKPLSFLLAASLILTMLPGGILMVKADSVSALQTELNLSYGSITIANGTASYTDSSGQAKTCTDANSYKITQNNSETATGNTISVTSGSAVITLAGVNISSAEGCAFSIASGASVSLTLSGTNTLRSGENKNGYSNAGLEVPSGAFVSITGTDNDNLNAYGSPYGAGIGSNGNKDAGTVTICGGRILAQGGDSGAGIGSAGYGSNSSYGKSATVAITGGNVIANGGKWAAGIGGGNGGNGGTVSISGGTVTAKGNNYSAGIGGAYGGNGGTVTISGGMVTASGGYEGAGIGGGNDGGNGGTVTISGGIVVANGSSYAAGIGGGTAGNGGTVTISGGTITANGGENSAGIGAGDGSGHNVSGGTVNITDGTVTATGGNMGAGIGGGFQSDGGTVTISGGNITANGGGHAAGIGGGSKSEGNTGGGGGSVTISGGHVEAYGGTNGGAGIGGGGSNDSDVNGGNGGTVTIMGGTVKAACYTGDSSNYSPAAGIGGGGNCGDGGTVLIIGGTVEADGGHNSAGIGGGMSGSGGAVTITGGSVTAATGYYGSAIGGGNGGNGGTVAISGGTVVTSGNFYGAGIGGGENGSGGNVTISGGTVAAATGGGGGKGIGCGNGGSNDGALTDDSGSAISCVTVDASVVIGGGKTVTGSVNGGRTCEMQTGSGGSLYFWMPADGRAVLLCNDVYYCISGSTSNVTLGNSNKMTVLDISKENIEINDSTVIGEDASGNPASVNSSNGYVIMQSGTDSAGHTVSVTGGSQNIVLRNVKIDVSGISDACAFSIGSGATAFLTLSGENVLASGASCAGLSVPAGASVLITGTATGSIGLTGGDSGAGIGGGSGNESGTVTINGGSIIAAGGESGAGIGGGNGGNGGTVTISGGAVKATCSGGGAGIGGGNGGNAGTTVINGGSVNASSIQGSPTNGSSSVYRTNVIVPSVTSVQAVDTLSIKQGNPVNYGTSGMSTDSSGTLYLYLPAYTDNNTTADLLVNNKAYMNYYGKVSAADGNTLKMNQSDLSIIGVKNSYTYKDNIFPTVTGGNGTGVVTGTYTGTDKITNQSYSSTLAPANVGSYLFTVQKKEDDSYYSSDTLSSAFSITPKSLSGCTLTLGKTMYEYTGQEIKPTFNLKDNDAVDPAYYTVSFANNTDVASAEDAEHPTVTVAGKGNYTDSLNAAFTIEAMPSISASGDTSHWAASVPVTIEATVGNSGLGNVTVTKASDPSHPQTLTGGTLASTSPTDETSTYTYHFSASSNDTYTFTVTDGINCTANESLIFTKIDTTSPNISVTGDTNTPSQNVILSISTSAGDSGIGGLKVSRSTDPAGTPAATLLAASSDTENHTAIYSYTAEMNATYTFTAYSGANVTASKSVTVNNIDTAQPVVRVNGNGYTGGTWTTSDVKLIVSDSNQNLGAASFIYRVTGGAWQPVNNKTILITSEGETNLQIRAESASGIAGPIVDYTVKIDRTAPVITADTAFHTSECNSSIPVSVSDTGAGVSSAAYQINGGAEQAVDLKTGSYSALTKSYACSIGNLPIGIYDVVIHARDKAGNTTTATVHVTNSSKIIQDGNTGIVVDLSGSTFTPEVTMVTLHNLSVAQSTSDYAMASGAISNSEGQKILSDLKIFLLELLDQNGQPITFTGKITVRIPIPSGMSGDLHVYWYNDTNGMVTDMNARQENGYLVFETTHFSYYAVAELSAKSSPGSGTIPNPETGSDPLPFLPAASLGIFGCGLIVVAKGRRFRKKSR